MLTCLQYSMPPVFHAQASLNCEKGFFFKIYKIIFSVHEMQTLLHCLWMALFFCPVHRHSVMNFEIRGTTWDSQGIGVERVSKFLHSKTFLLLDSKILKGLRRPVSLLRDAQHSVLLGGCSVLISVWGGLNSFPPTSLQSSFFCISGESSEKVENLSCFLRVLLF